MRTEASRHAQKRRGKRAAATDAVALLKQDHEKVLEMFKKFGRMAAKGDDEGKVELVRTICEELKVHTTIEEEIFYPAVRAAIDEELMMDEALVEHDSAKSLIAQIEEMQPGDERYDATVTVLGEYIQHHVNEEQKEMFPKAKKAKVDLSALGEEIAERKKELLAEGAGTAESQAAGAERQ
jgi:hemerythrin-like domain-containing protein